VIDLVLVSVVIDLELLVLVNLMLMVVSVRELRKSDFERKLGSDLSRSREQEAESENGH
jgi:hypothetical protein